MFICTNHVIIQEQIKRLDNAQCTPPESHLSQRNPCRFFQLLPGMYVHMYECMWRHWYYCGGQAACLVGCILSLECMCVNLKVAAWACGNQLVALNYQTGDLPYQVTSMLDIFILYMIASYTHKHTYIHTNTLPMMGSIATVCRFVQESYMQYIYVYIHLHE